MRQLSPLFFAMLPALASSAPIPAAWAADDETVTTTIEPSNGRLMGKIQPIDKLTPEAEGIFKVSVCRWGYSKHACECPDGGVVKVPS